MAVRNPPCISTVGHAKTTGPQRKGTYVGPWGEIAGATLIFADVDEDTVGCQFDDIYTGYGFGWHAFPRADIAERDSDA